MTPFIITADFVEESDVNGAQISSIGLFTPNGIKSNVKKTSHKNQQIDFSEEHCPRVIKTNLSRIWIQILNRNLEPPLYNTSPLFNFGTTIMVLLFRDG